MITVETPLKSIRTQRRGLEVLLVSRRDRRDFILGALAVLDWIEQGAKSPLESLSTVTFDAVQADS